jgi:hypothetical protein
MNKFYLLSEAKYSGHLYEYQVTSLAKNIYESYRLYLPELP